MSGDWEANRHTAPWRRVAGPAGLLVAGLIAGLVAFPSSSRPTLPIAVEPTSAPDPGPPPAAEPDREAGGRWRPMAAGPLPARQHPVSAWTGSELLVWGGRVAQRGRWFADGAAYDVHTDRWRRLPPSPLRARASASGVWTGTELLIWGGAGAADESGEPRGVVGPRVETARTTQAFADGAAYNPRTNRWRPLPAAPLSPRRAAAAVWTGTHMVVWGGRDIFDDSHRSDGARYDPAADRWTPLRGGPLDRHDGSLLRAVALDGRVLVWASDAATARAAVYDAASDSWERIAAPPLDPAVLPSMATVAGGVMVWGTGRSDDAPVALRYTGSAGRWIRVAPPPSAPAGDRPLIAADATAIAWQPAGGVVYDGVFDRWEQLRAGPDLPADALHTWAGDRLVLWSPGTAPGNQVRAATWVPEDPWRALPEPPVSTDAAGTAVATGARPGDQQVLLWGGLDEGSHEVGAAYDPLVRLWEALPRSPLSRRVDPAGAWVMPEMVVVGGRDLPDAPALDDAAAYRPSSDTWRRLADVPMAVAGDALAVRGARIYAAGLQGQDVAVATYDTTGRDTWQQLPPPPIAPGVDRLHVAWTGAELWVWGTRADDEGAGAAWSPRGRWRELPGLKGVTGRVAWTWAGSRAFVLAEDGTTASLGRDAVRWRRHARSPMRSASVVITWNGHALLAFDPAAPWTVRMATLQPHSSQWAAFPSPPLPKHRDGRLLSTGQSVYAFAGHVGAELTR